MLGILFLLATALALSAPASAQEFVPGSEDVPLLSGLIANEQDTIIFDSPTGRIVEAFAAGLVSRQAVTAFYTDTLPALGWSREGTALSFRREEERLTVDIFEAEGSLTVRFTLAPA